MLSSYDRHAISQYAGEALTSASYAEVDADHPIAIVMNLVEAYVEGHADPEERALVLELQELFPTVDQYLTMKEETQPLQPNFVHAYLDRQKNRRGTC